MIEDIRVKLHPETREAFRALQHSIPLPYKVTLYARPGMQKKQDVVGLCSVKVGKGDKQHGRIMIDPRESLDEEKEILIHEYAHLMTYEYPGTSQNEVWGVAYSECYSVVFGDH